MNQIEEYRGALDGLRFSAEGKKRMMNGLMEAGEGPVKGKHFHPLRTALIAAALCLALVGTVVAVQHFGVKVDLQTNPAHPGDNYTVTDGIAFFPADSFPQQVHDLAAENRAVGIGEKCADKKFESWAEMENFLGRALPGSTVLDSATLTGSAQLWAYAVDQGLSSVDAEASCVLDGIQVRQSAQLYTDKAEQNYKEYGKEGEAFQGGIVMTYEGGSAMTEETYTTPGGLTAAIVEVVPAPDSMTPVVEYNAHFSIDGIRYMVRASLYEVGMTPKEAADVDDPAHTLDVLKTVLDGFILEK